MPMKIKLLIDYANGNYLLLWAFYNNKIELVKLLINYAYKNNIILELYGNSENKNYLLS